MPDLTGAWGWVGAANSPSQMGCKFGGKAVRLLGDGRVAAAGLNRVGGVVLMVCIINSRGEARRPRELSFTRPNARRSLHRKHRRQQDGGNTKVQ